jgi:hypothetical protein
MGMPAYGASLAPRTKTEHENVKKPASQLAFLFELGKAQGN